VAYVLICYLISALFCLLSTALLLFFVGGLTVLSAQPSDPAELWAMIGHLLSLTLKSVLALGALYPISALFFFLWIPFQHAFVLLFARRNQRGLTATTRLSCYATGATILLSLLPLVGLLAIPYSFYLLTSGLKRVHRTSNARALATVFAPQAILLVLLSAGAFFAIKTLGDTRPVAALGLSERVGSLPPDAVDYGALAVDHPYHERLRELRSDSYDRRVPRARYGVEVMVATTTPPGYEPRGITGQATDSGRNGLYVGPGDPTRSVGDDGDEISYVASVRQSGAYGSGEFGTFCQGFIFRGRKPYTVELKQVSDQWRTLYVRAYSARDPNAKESVAYFCIDRAGNVEGSQETTVDNSMDEGRT
jgi:hypothetical protein